MGTSANIKIKNTNITIYKHYDGYQSGTMPFLIDFTTDFLNKRGNDENYFIAQLLRASQRLAEKYQLDKSTATGWGLFWGDDEVCTDYTYEIDLNKKTISVNGRTLFLSDETMVKNYLNQLDEAA